MKNWNDAISEVMISLSRQLKEWAIELINFTSKILNDYNSFLVIFFILLTVGLYFYYKFKFSDNKEDFIFKWGKIGNFLFQTIIIFTLGFLIKLAKVPGIKEALNKYWYLGFLIIFFCLILLIKDVAIYHKSRKKVFAGYSKLYNFLGLSYIFTAITLSKLGFINQMLMVTVFIFFWMIIQLIINEINKEDGITTVDSDREIDSYDQMLPTRKKELNRILETLKRNRYDEPFALTINGDWGTGKTSFVNVLSKQLKSKGNPIIFIQPMVLDTSEKQMEYFFEQLKSILSINGIYTGMGSPFKNYLRLVLNMLNVKPLLQLEKVFLSSDDDNKNDFRKNKQLLEEDIQRLFNKGKKKITINPIKEKQKIYIIIDDFDRVEEETMFNTLVFIKELVNFKGINVLFLMDDRKLENEINFKINREYLDKFVNSKIHLSNLEYTEIYNHFSSIIKEEDFHAELLKEVARYFRENVINQINQIDMKIEERVSYIQVRIDRIPLDDENEGNKLINEERLKQWEKQKKDLNDYLITYKNGINNLRKSKKIIRAVKEFLMFCDEEIKNRENNYFFENLNSINTSGIIFRIAVVKVLYSEIIDGIIQTNDTKLYLQEKNNDFLQIIFDEYFSDYVTEEKEMTLSILNEFCNALILTRPFPDSLFKEKTTETIQILADLDNDGSLNIQGDYINKINKYLEVFYYNSWNVDSNKVEARTLKLIDFIFELFEQNTFMLVDLFMILPRQDKHPFVRDKVYLERINQIFTVDKGFQNNNEKNISLQNLENLELHTIVEYKTDILTIMRFLKLESNSYSYETFKADLEDVYSLKEMKNSVVRIFEFETDIDNDICYLEKWIEDSITEIRDQYQEEYILISVEICERRLQRFIEYSLLIEEVINKVKNSSINKNVKFKEKVVILSLQELISDIDEFHQYIITDENDVESYQTYFNSILGHLERMTKSSRVNASCISKVEEIYRSINWNVNREKRHQWITMKIAEINQNLTRYGVDSE